MSHHDHSHGHSHSHSHDPGSRHSHSHSHGGGPEEMSFADRMEKLLDHWLEHNTDHAATYRQWAEKARENGMDAVAAQLEEAARMTLEINETFSAAAQSLK